MELFLVATIISMTPLLFATFGAILCEKAGNLNLGVEGMMLIGAVSGFGIGQATGNPILAMMGAGLFAGMSSLIYGFLTISLRANQVVTGLALTIFGTGISSILGSQFIGQKMPEVIIDFFKPVPIPFLSNIPFIGNILFNHDYFIYFGYLMTVVLTIYLFKTNIGLNLKAVGENAAAADSVGVSVSLYKYVHVALGGVFAGLGGAYLAIIDVPQWQDNITAGKGWIAIALVIFSRWNPAYAFFAAAFFGGLNIIGFRIQSLNISQNLLDMLPYVATIIVLVLSSLGKSKDHLSPNNLGLAFYREER